MFKNETLASLVISFSEMPCVIVFFIFFLVILIGYHGKNYENNKICDVSRVFPFNKCPSALPWGVLILGTASSLGITLNIKI
jgi:hypothetical protein